MRRIGPRWGLNLLVAQKRCVREVSVDVRRAEQLEDVLTPITKAFKEYYPK